MFPRVTRNRTWRAARATLLCGGLLLGLAGCGGPPTEQLNQASTALNGAALAKKCAPEEYEAAEKMLAKAKALSAEGKHDEAKSAALAAKKLADKAQQKALLRKEECLNPKAGSGGIDPNDLVEVDPGPSSNLNDEAGLQTIYFEYNAAELTGDARQTLTSNASWMRNHSDRRVVVEGHCDSRGSTEYNLALGERRGLMVRNYLSQMGITPDRVEVVSYGEEQPIDYGSNEAAFSRNRRAEFRTR